MWIINFFKKLFKKNTKTNEKNKIKKNTLLSKLKNLFNSNSYKDIEETLLRADIDFNTVQEIIKDLKSKKENSNESLKEVLQERIQSTTVDFDKNQTTILFIMGINGVGKTTIISKIAKYYKDKNKKVLLSAADTYRAAAIEQLVHWADLLKLPYVAQSTGADPASVVFDSIDKAVKGKYDLCIVDTAGRLHNKEELMNQLRKIDKVVEKKKDQYGNLLVHKSIVLDANLGKNSLIQFETFNELVKLDSFSVTKLDSTAKGGVLFSICNKHHLPISYVSFGENIEAIKSAENNDLINFVIEKI